MKNSIISLLLIQIILIALNAVFASAELAVLSVNESKINRLSYTINIQHLLSLVKLLNPRRIHRNVRL